MANHQPDQQNDADPPDPFMRPAYIVFIQGDPDKPHLIAAVTPNYPGLFPEQEERSEDEAIEQNAPNPQPQYHLSLPHPPQIPLPTPAQIAPPSVQEYYELINFKSPNAPTDNNPFCTTNRNELLQLLEMAGVASRLHREETVDLWALDKLRSQRHGQNGRVNIHSRHAQHQAQGYFNTLTNALDQQRRRAAGHE